MSPSNRPRNVQAPQNKPVGFARAGFIRAKAAARTLGIRYGQLKHALSTSQLPGILTGEHGDSERRVWWIHQEVLDALRDMNLTGIRAGVQLLPIDPQRPGMIQRGQDQ